MTLFTGMPPNEVDAFVRAQLGIDLHRLWPSCVDVASRHENV